LLLSIDCFDACNRRVDFSSKINNWSGNCDNDTLVEA
jgi:hypothetical protein